MASPLLLDSHHPADEGPGFCRVLNWLDVKMVDSNPRSCYAESTYHSLSCLLKAGWKTDLWEFPDGSTPRKSAPFRTKGSRLLCTAPSSEHSLECGNWQHILITSNQNKNLLLKNVVRELDLKKKKSLYLLDPLFLPYDFKTCQNKLWGMICESRWLANSI